jgi:hypothetical protein
VKKNLFFRGKSQHFLEENFPQNFPRIFPGFSPDFPRIFPGFSSGKCTKNRPPDDFFSGAIYSREFRQNKVEKRPRCQMPPMATDRRKKLKP